MDLIQGNTEPQACIIVSVTVLHIMCMGKHGLGSAVSNPLLTICNRPKCETLLFS